jgi:Ca2+-binding RTX toxin-like protein
VTWTSEGQDGSGTGIYQRIYSVAELSALTMSQETVTGTSADDVILSLHNGLSAGDDIDGGAGLDTIELTEAGTLDARNGTLTGIERLVGSAGNDTIYGTTANETIEGRDGNDNLAGEGGADTLIGGVGDDIYITDGGDTLVEQAGEGTDEVQSSVSHTLGAAFEILTLTGTANIEGKGNSAANAITGNAGNNRLEGGGGSDVLAGAAGQDWLAGGQGGDVLYGGAGNDTLIADGAVTWDYNAASVRRLYIATLDRGPDDGGLQNWTEALRSGQSLNSIVSGFINSTEFSNVYGALSNTAFVTTLYNNVLNRAADSAGLNSWISQLNSGTSREAVVLGFSESAEFQITSEVRDIAGQVFRMYDSAFNRTADAGGFAGWWDAMYGGTSIGEIANAFINSAEFTLTYGALDSLSNSQYVQLLYNNVLNRSADSGGLNHWINQLANGMTRANLLITFSESTEHVNLTASGLDSFMRNNLADWRDVLVGESGINHLTGHRGSDTYTVTAGDAGTHYVYGLETFDSLRLLGFGYSNSGQALAAMSQSGGDVVLTAGSTTVRFVDTQLSTLQNLGSSGWVFS